MSPPSFTSEAKVQLKTAKADDAKVPVEIWNAHFL
jgi:hypothetical protein